MKNKKQICKQEKLCISKVLEVKRIKFLSFANSCTYSKQWGICIFAKCGEESAVMWSSLPFPTEPQTSAKGVDSECLTVNSSASQVHMMNLHRTQLTLWCPFSGDIFYMDFEESCLLIRTSRSLSLALIFLYSLYSSSTGTRSSFWAFLWKIKSDLKVVLVWSVILQIYGKIKAGTGTTGMSHHCPATMSHFTYLVNHSISGYFSIHHLKYNLFSFNIKELHGKCLYSS